MNNIQKLVENKRLYLEYEQAGNFELALYHFEQKNYFEEEIEKERNRNNFQNDPKEYNHKKLETYREFYNQMNEIIKICSTINFKLDLESLINILFEEFSKVFVLDSIMFSLCDEYLTKVNYSVFIEKGNHNIIDNYPIGDRKTVGEYCIYNKKSILIEDADLECKLYVVKDNNCEVPTEVEGVSKSMIFSPMLINGNIIGYVSVQSYEKTKYTYNDVLKLEILAGYLAIALENIKLYKGVEYIAETDYITGLLNRQGIIKQGDISFKRFKENDKELSILMVDLDYLKQINDTYGHLTGDKIIIGTAEAIKNGIRLGDSSGRYGGEEFLVLLPETDIDKATMVAERIRKNIEDYKIEVKGERQIGCTASFGVYQFEKDAESFGEGINKADEAMYTAKNKGRNQVIKYAK